jgi:hypothetical protein
MGPDRVEALRAVQEWSRRRPPSRRGLHLCTLLLCLVRRHRSNGEPEYRSAAGRDGHSHPCRMRLDVPGHPQQGDPHKPRVRDGLHGRAVTYGDWTRSNRARSSSARAACGLASVAIFMDNRRSTSAGLERASRPLLDAVSQHLQPEVAYIVGDCGATPSPRTRKQRPALADLPGVKHHFCGRHGPGLRVLDGRRCAAADPIADSWGPVLCSSATGRPKASNPLPERKIGTPPPLLRRSQRHVGCSRTRCTLDSAAPPRRCASR